MIGQLSLVERYDRWKNSTIFELEIAYKLLKLHNAMEESNSSQHTKQTHTHIYIYIHCTAMIHFAVSAVLHQWHDEHIPSTLLQLEFSSSGFFSFWSTQLKSSNETSQISQLGENSLWKTAAKKCVLMHSLSCVKIGKCFS